MALATLSIDIVAKLASLEAGMGRAERLVQQSAAQMAGHFEKLQSAAGAVGGVLGGAFAVTGLTQWLRATVDGIDAFNDLADVTGASIENISALEDVAMRTGHTLETVGEAIIKLSKGLADTNPQGEYSKALASIGLEAAKLREMDPALAVKEVADALAKYEDGASKARIEQVLYSKSVREVVPYLRDLAEATTLTATVTTEQAAAADRWNKQLAELQANATNLARSLVGELLPGLSETLRLFQELQKGPGLLATLGQSMKISFDTAADGLRYYSEELGKVDKQIASIKKMASEDGNKGLALANRNLLAGLEEDRAKLAKFAEAYRNTVNAAGAGAGRGTGQIPARAAVAGIPEQTRVPRVPSAATAAAKEVQSYADTVAQAVAKMVSDTDLVRIGELNAQLEQLNKLAAAGLDPQIVNQVRAKLESQRPVTGPNQAAEDFRRLELGSDAALESLIKYNDQADRLNQLLSGTSSSLLDEQRRDMLLLAEALERGAIGEKQYLEAVQQRLAEGAQGADKTKTAAQELGLTFTSAFEDALVSGEKFGDVMKGLEKDLIRIFARKYVINPIMNAAGNWLDSAGGIGGILGSLFGGLFANGGAFGQSAPIPFAAGGVFNSPHLFKFANGGAMATGVLGEAGPEAIMPLFRGPGGKLGVQMHGSGGGTVNITQHISVGAGASRNEVMAAMQVAKAQAIAEIQDARQRGRTD